MAHITYVTGNVTSYHNASFELMRRLRAAGHRVTYLSAANLGARVEAQGFDFVPLPRPGASPGRRTRLEGAVRALGVDALPDMLASLAPDVLLIDIELHAHIIQAVPLGYPVLLINIWFSVWKHPGLPPLHTELSPASSGRLGMEAAWLRFRVEKVARRAWRRARTRGADRVSALRLLARRTGFPFDEEVELNQWVIPITYRTLPVLCLNAWELELPHTPRPNVHYVGPMIYRARKDPSSVRDEAALERVLEQHRRPDGARTLIYATHGTLKGDPSFLRRVIEAVRARPAWELVLGLGGQLDPGALGPLPPNVHAFAWVPQLRVLERADLALTHGGISTINECIHFGVPMVTYSTGHVDQNGCAVRVAYHGVGLTGRIGADDAGAIRAKLERVLGEPAFKENILQMQEAVRRYEREQVAERLIESVLSDA